MPNFGKSSKSKNKKKNWKSPAKFERELPLSDDDEPTGPDLINNLNNDCLIRIFQHVVIADRFCIGRVCKRWRSLSKFAWENMTTLSFIETDKASDLYQLPPNSRSNKGVEKLLKKCGPHVRDLTLGAPCDCRIMPIVSKYCENLRILLIDFDCHNWNSDAFFPHLQKVTFQYRILRNRISISEKALQSLPSKSLTEIDLYAVPTSNTLSSTLPRTAAATFKDFTKLSKLTMNNFLLEPQVVNAISEMSTLTSLDITSCFLRGGLPRLTLLTNLEDLNLSLVQQVNNIFLNEVTKNCHKLKNLTLYGCPFTDQGIMNFRDLPKLENLDMCEVEAITDAPLGDLKNLKRLDCRGCPGVHDDGIIKLMVNAKNLTFLDVQDTAITEKTLGIANLITEARTNNLPLTISVNKHVQRNWNRGRGDVSRLLIFQADGHHMPSPVELYDMYPERKIHCKLVRDPSKN